ncbi:MAG: VCBS repeat-containing protein [Planctomycetales bacterium]|nr:VCBS repeat-containing protein [Planctomycetales bacterium]
MSFPAARDCSDAPFSVQPVTAEPSVHFSLDASSVNEADGIHTIDITLNLPNGPLTEDVVVWVTDTLDGSAEPAVPITHGIGENLSDLATADINNDGFPDVITSNWTSSDLSILLSTGGETFLPEVRFPMDELPGWVATADVNVDGNVDLIITHDDPQELSILLGAGDGTFSAMPRFEMPGGRVTPADFNEDGFIDLVASRNSGLNIALGNGDGTFQPYEHLNINGDPLVWATADFNGDGHLDLASPGGHGAGYAMSVFLGAGDGTFGAETLIPTGETMETIAAADLNHDGRVDLITGNYFDQVKVFLGNGDGSFQPGTSLASGSGIFYQLLLADLNQDGHLDIFTGFGQHDTIGVHFGAGDGTFSQPREFVSGGGEMRALVTADVNADGLPDVVVANGSPQTVNVLFGREGGYLARQAVGDYQIISSPFIRFPAGSVDGATQQVVVEIIDDDIPDNAETFRIEIAGMEDPTGQLSIAEPSLHEVTIFDDDTAARVEFSIDGTTSVTSDALDADLNLATYTIGYTGELGNGETASVEAVMQLGTSRDDEFWRTLNDAILLAASNIAGIAVEGSRVIFSGGAGNVASLTFSLEILDDQLCEADHFFSIQLQNAQVSNGGSASIAEATQTTFIVCGSTGGPRIFYVNDQSRTGDEYSHAVGNNANDGLSATSPRASIRSILDAYDLNPGDTIFVDTGTYVLSENLAVALEDTGVRITGPQQDGHVATLSRGNQNAGNYVFDLSSVGEQGVTIEHFTLTSGQHGVYAGPDALGRNLVVQFNQIRLNGRAGVRMDAARAGTHISNNLVAGNGEGLRITARDESGDVLVSRNIVSNNQHGNGIVANGKVEIAENTIKGHNDINYRPIGILMYNGVTARHNLLFNNDSAIWAPSRPGHAKSMIVGNRIFYNQAGILVQGANEVRENVLYLHGNSILSEVDLSFKLGFVGERFSGLISNNLIYGGNPTGNSSTGVSLDATTIDADGNHARILNNTFVDNTYAVTIRDYFDTESNTQVFPEGFEIRNNIFTFEYNRTLPLSIVAFAETEFQSDYNVFHIVDGDRLASVHGQWPNNGSIETLSQWQQAWGQDLHSIVAAPLFVDPDGADDRRPGEFAIDAGYDDDFHLQSAYGQFSGSLAPVLGADGLPEFLPVGLSEGAANSPAIDAGDRSSAFDHEPNFNGGIINAGAYGNTPQASLSEPTVAADIAFYTEGSESVTPDPNDADANLATYTIGYTGILAEGATASVDVQHIFGETTSHDYANTIGMAIAEAIVSIGFSGLAYDGVNSRLIFTGGPDAEASLTFSLQIADDGFCSASEDFAIELANPLASAGAASIANARQETTIACSPLTFYIEGSEGVLETASEGAANVASYTIWYYGDLPEGDTASVDVSLLFLETDAADFVVTDPRLCDPIFGTCPDQSNGDVYFEQGRLYFRGGEGRARSFSFELSIFDDALIEGDETFAIELSAPTTSSDLPISIYEPLQRVETTIFDDDVPPPVEVLGIEVTPGAVGIRLTGPVHAEMLNLYDGVTGANGAADVSLIRADGTAAHGSLLWDADANLLWFLKTGGPFEPGDYTLRLRGGPLGVFHEAHELGHLQIDYVETFTIEPFAGHTLHIPDVLAAPGESIDVDETGGIPIRIDNAEGVRSIAFQLDYDPAMVVVFDVQIPAQLPPDWLLQFDISTPGLLLIQAQGNEPLPAGAMLWATIEASIAPAAAIGASSMLSWSNLSINGGEAPLRGDEAIVQVGAAGDLSGDATLSALDASLAARVAVGLDSGFAHFARTDPMLLADLSHDGTISALDASLIARRALGLPDMPQMQAATEANARVADAAPPFAALDLALADEPELIKAEEPAAEFEPAMALAALRDAALLSDHGTSARDDYFLTIGQPTRDNDSSDAAEDADGQAETSSNPLR